MMDSEERLLEAERTASEAFALAEVACNLAMLLAARVGLPGPEGQETPQEWLERLLEMEEKPGLEAGELERGAIAPKGRS